MPDNFRFDSKFQDLILASFIRHPDVFLKYGLVLKASYFEGVQATAVAYAVLNHLEKHGRSPSWELLRQLARDQMSKLSLEGDSATIEYVERLRELKTDDYEYVATRVVEFARERATISAIKQAVELIQEGKLPDDGFVPLFEKALAIGQDLDDLGLLFHHDAEAIIDKVTNVQYGTKTGFPAWDRLWYHGWGPGWLIALVAPPKRWKTAMCLNLALNMVSPAYEYDVLYYPCEITQELAALRMFQRLTGTTLQEIYDAPNAFKGTLRAAINTSVAGNLVIKGYPSNGVTLATIKAHAKMARERYKLKRLGAVIIDYADTVRPVGTFDREDLAQKAIYEQARAIGFEFSCPVIMPDRMTKDATEQQVPDMRSFQGAYAKGGVVDVAIGLCATDAEYYRNILRTFVFFNRHGPAGKHFRGKVDPDIMAIEVGEELEYDAEADHGSDRRRRRVGRNQLPEGLEDSP